MELKELAETLERTNKVINVIGFRDDVSIETHRELLYVQDSIRHVSAWLETKDHTKKLLEK